MAERHGRPAPGAQDGRVAKGDALCETTRLYHEHADALRRALGASLAAPDALVEDACAFAWLQLLRTEPSQERIGGWLYVVARHEALRLLRAQRRTDPLDGAGSLADPRTPEDALAAREALGALAGLRPRQGRVLALKVAGFSYAEIAQQTGDTRRTVERQLRRARAALREVAQA